jgi:GNAT superfamily N-acetyltransferase
MIGLRAARTTDAGSVGAILSEFARTTDWMPKLYTGAQDIAHAGALIDRGWVIVAEDDSTVVGFAACDSTELDALFVAEFMRGQGVGSALLDHLKTGADTLELWTSQANEAAQRFYVQHGFQEMARTDGAGNDEKLADIQYVWKREAV